MESEPYPQYLLRWLQLLDDAFHGVPLFMFAVPHKLWKPMAKTLPQQDNVRITWLVQAKRFNSIRIAWNQQLDGSSFWAYNFSVHSQKMKKFQETSDTDTDTKRMCSGGGSCGESQSNGTGCVSKSQLNSDKKHEVGYSELLRCVVQVFLRTQPTQAALHPDKCSCRGVDEKERQPCVNAALQQANRTAEDMTAYVAGRLGRALLEQCGLCGLSPHKIAPVPILSMLKPVVCSVAMLRGSQRALQTHVTKEEENNDSVSVSVGWPLRPGGESSGFQQAVTGTQKNVPSTEQVTAQNTVNSSPEAERKETADVQSLSQIPLAQPAVTEPVDDGDAPAETSPGCKETPECKQTIERDTTVSESMGTPFAAVRDRVRWLALVRPFMMDRAADSSSDLTPPTTEHKGAGAGTESGGNVDLPDIMQVLGCARTVGTLSAVPPALSDLVMAFNAPHKRNLKECITVGARALCKHTNRYEVAAAKHMHGQSPPLDTCGGPGLWVGHPYWPPMSAGTNAYKNAVASWVLLRVLCQAVWTNTHQFNSKLRVFEVRGPEGYGARWTVDQEGRVCQFRGFCEPFQEDGHERGWKTVV